MTNQLLFGVNYFNQTFSDANNSFNTKALGLFLSPDATIKGQPISGRPEYRDRIMAAALSKSALRRPKAATTSLGCWPTSFPITSAGTSSVSAANSGRDG